MKIVSRFALLAAVLVSLSVDSARAQSPPSLATIGDRTTDEGVLLSFTATAIDPDLDPLSFSLDPGEPTGASITSGGDFSWMPLENAGPGTYPITVRVSDGALSDFETIQVRVDEVNSAPILAPIGDQVGTLGVPITFTAAATDADAPTNTLTFSLDAGAPAGAAIDPAIGAFSWTPAFIGTFSVTVRVTDDGAPSLDDSETITITVAGGNSPPVLATIANYTVDENTLLSFTATATDADGDPLAFSLEPGAPAGAAITPGGIFAWTPGEGHGPGVYAIGVLVSDGTLFDAQTFTVTVREVAQPPVVTAPATVTGHVGGSVDFVALASDPDGDPIEGLAAAPLPTGATFTPGIGNTAGNFHWVPGSTQVGPFSVVISAFSACRPSNVSGSFPVCDIGTATVSITIAPNASPVIATIGDRSVVEGSPLTFTATAFDPDSDPFAFSLDPGAPAGASITAGGDFSWTPTEAQGPGAYPITVRASDATLSDTETFTATVGEVNQAPVLAAIGNSTTPVLSDFSFTASATDADLPANVLAFSLGAGAPAGAAIDPVTGSFHWTPITAQTGDNPITVIVTDDGSPSLNDSETFHVTVTNEPPVLAPIADRTVDEGSSLSFLATAVDPEFGPMTFTLDPGAPPGASITPGGGFAWTPTESQGPGFYSITVRVSDGNQDDADDFLVTVNDVDSPAVVTAPLTSSVEELGELAITVTASDPDDGVIDLLVFDPAGLPAGNDAVFTTNASNTEGQLVWHPQTGDAGAYVLTFIAFDPESVGVTTSIQVHPEGTKAVGQVTWTPPATAVGSFTVTFTAVDADNEVGTATTEVTVIAGSSTQSPTRMMAPKAPGEIQRGPIISVAASVTIRTGETLLLEASALDPDRGPIISFTADISKLPGDPTFSSNLDPQVSAPPAVEGQADVAIQFQVSAVDPDGDAILSLTMDRSALPQTATPSFITSPDHTIGTFLWTPGVVDARDVPYPIIFSATNALVVSATTAITVRAVNRAPTADPDGPYSGVVGMPIVFDGTGSSDPDGDALQYSWSFGDGMTGVGPTPSHTYATAGTFPVELRVEDVHSLSNSANTQANIASHLSGTAFVSGGNRVIRLRSSKPYSCVQVEPLDGAFAIADVDPTSVVLRSEGTGSVSEIVAIPDKTGVVRDSDGNGADEIGACFAKEDLRLLFSHVNGKQVIPVQVAGRLSAGGAFSAPLTLEVVGSSGGIAAVVAPNPFNPRAVLSFELARGGLVRVQLFDLNGRLVRDLVPGAMLEAGYHDVVIDARGRNGAPLASGVYFYRLTAPEGTNAGRVVVME